MSCWPIPSIEEYFDTLQRSAYFTTIDMSWGFYQLPMEPKNQNYPAFSTSFGSFKGLRMPMGLTGSPNTFQSLMEHVLIGLTWNITVPYLDDGIIFSKTPEDNIKRIQQVFQRFHEANLKTHPTKSAFFPNKSSGFRTRNQQKWIGSRSRKGQSSSKLPSTTKSNKC